jgi:hypothetical protein
LIQNGALTCRLFAVDAKAVFLSVYFRLVRVEASSLFIGELRHPSILETPLDLGHNYSFVKPGSLTSPLFSLATLVWLDTGICCSAAVRPTVGDGVSHTVRSSNELIVSVYIRRVHHGVPSDASDFRSCSWFRIPLSSSLSMYA